MTRTTWLALPLLIMLLAACGHESASADPPPAAGNPPTAELGGRLTITGSSTIAPLIGEIARRFESQHPGVRIDVQTGGSSRGIADARTGLADIGMASRSLKDDEDDLHGFAIARDGIAIILHRDNPLAALSDQQIVGIYTGRIANWREVGGRDAPITVVNKAEGRSTLELFSRHFDLEAGAVRASVIIGDNEQGVRTVAGNPDAIGYVSIGTAETDIARGIAIKMLPLGGISPSSATVRDGTFPLSRPLTLVTRSEPAGLAREFIDFARSPAVDDLVAAQAFVPLTR